MPIQRIQSGKVERKVLAQPKIFNADQLRVLGHLLLDRQIDQLLHNLLLPLPLPPVLLRYHYRLNEILLLSYYRVYFLLAPEVVLNWLSGDGQS